MWREDTGLREGVRSCSTPIPNPHLAEVSRPRRNRRTPGAAKTPLPPDPEPNQEAARKPMGTKSTFCNRHASWLAPISSSVSPGIAGWHQTRVLEATGALFPQNTGPDAYITPIRCHLSRQTLTELRFGATQAIRRLHNSRLVPQGSHPPAKRGERRFATSSKTNPPSQGTQV